MKKIKLLFLITSLNIGGTERFLVDLANALSRSRFEIGVCILRKKRSVLVDELRKDITKYYASYSSKNLLSLKKKLQDVINEFKPDIVHSLLYMDNILAGMVKNRGKYTLICSQRGRIFSRSNTVSIRLREWIQTFFFQKADLILTNSYDGKKSLLNQRVYVPIRVIYTGKEEVAVREKERLRRCLNIRKDAFVFGSVGNLVWYKGHETLIAAFEKLAKIHTNILLLIIGEGRKRDALRKRISALGLEQKVILTGSVRNVEDYLAASDMFVLPSLSEGLSNAAIEALRAGLPVIATNVGGNPEIVRNGKEGILVQPKDPHALYNAMHVLVKDKRVRRKFSQNARKRYEAMFTLKRSIQQYEKAYLNVIRGEQ